MYSARAREWNELLYALYVAVLVIISFNTNEKSDVLGYSLSLLVTFYLLPDFLQIINIKWFNFF